MYSSSQVRGGGERERERLHVSFITRRRVTGPRDGAASGCGVVFLSPFRGKTYDNLLATALTFEEKSRSSWSLMIPCSPW